MKDQRSYDRTLPVAPTCGDCGGATVQQSSRTLGEWSGEGAPIVWWVCSACGARTRRREGRRQGTPANGSLRRLRRQVHTRIDPLWQDEGFERDEVYEAVAFALDLPRRLAHVGMLNEAQCHRLIRADLRAIMQSRRPPPLDRT